MPDNAESMSSALLKRTRGTRLARWLRESRWRLAFGHVALYIAIMLPLALLMDIWRKTDLLIFDWLITHEQPVQFNHAQIAVLDLDKPIGDVNATEIFRGRVAAALQELTRHGPRAVVLDMMYTERGGNNLRLLQEAIAALKAKEVSVYAVVPITPDEAGYDWKSRALMDDVYNRLTGYGHTMVRCWPLTKTFWYEAAVLPGQPVQALPIVLAKELRSDFSPPKGTILLRYGRPLGAGSGYVHAGDGSNRFDGSVFEHKVAIVGSTNGEKKNDCRKGGPELLAWAVNNLVNQNAGDPVLWAGPILMLSVVALFSALAAWSLWRLTTETARLGARGAAFYSCGRVVLLLLVCVYGLLKAHQVYPQITLPILGIIVASALAWNFRRIAPAWRPLLTDIPPNQYHFFVSYSHRHRDWVEKEIYRRLRDCKTKSGKPAEIFFDSHAIFCGERWEQKLAEGVANSRYFIAVYSEDYFTSKWCRWELDRALERHGSTDEKFSIFPLVYGDVKVPSKYSKIQHLPILETPDYFKRLLNAIKRKDRDFGDQREWSQPTNIARRTWRWLRIRRAADD